MQLWIYLWLTTICCTLQEFDTEGRICEKQDREEELLLLPCEEVKIGSAMIKEKPREKKKTANSNGNSNGGGASGIGTGSGMTNMEIKTEPVERERENDNLKEEPSVLSDETVPMSADKSAEHSPIQEAKNPSCQQSDICLSETGMFLSFVDVEYFVYKYYE